MTPDERDEIKRLHAELVDVLLDDENDEVCTECYEAFTTRLDSLTDEGTTGVGGPYPCCPYDDEKPCPQAESGHDLPCNGPHCRDQALRADAAEARLAAVRALPERWRAEAAYSFLDRDFIRGAKTCRWKLAAELQAALDGET